MAVRTVMQHNLPTGENQSVVLLSIPAAKILILSTNEKHFTLNHYAVILKKQNKNCINF